jgi:hypothetical protein
MSTQATLQKLIEGLMMYHLTLKWKLLMLMQVSSYQILIFH